MLNAFVLTGGPCVGKTTLINALRERGYMVTAEMATAVINDGLFPWVDPVAFRKEVLNRQLDVEAGAAARARMAFLDRGAYDGMAYCVATGAEIPDFLGGLVDCRYRLVFLVEELPFWVNDGIRYEDPAFTRRITPILEQVYRDKGATVIRVPSMSVEDRLSLIVSEANRLALAA